MGGEGKKKRKTYESPRRAQRAGMHAFQDAMFGSIDLRDSRLGGRAPDQEHDPSGPLLGYNINDFLREFFPPFVRMAVGFPRAHGQDGIEQEDTLLGPGDEQAAFVGRRLERRVIAL